MSIYENFRNSVSMGRKAARIGIIAGTLLAVPYICDDGCAVLSGYARADEKQETVAQTTPSETLETVISE